MSTHACNHSWSRSTCSYVIFWSLSYTCISCHYLSQCKRTHVRDLEELTQALEDIVQPLKSLEWSQNTQCVSFLSHFIAWEKPNKKRVVLMIRPNQICQCCPIKSNAIVVNPKLLVCMIIDQIKVQTTSLMQSTQLYTPIPNYADKQCKSYKVNASSLKRRTSTFTY